MGAVVTFLDISDRKQNETLQQQMQGQIVAQKKWPQSVIWQPVSPMRSTHKLP